MRRGEVAVVPPDTGELMTAEELEIPKRGYAPFAPDLAAEVLSPGDRPGEVLSKVGDWLDAGAAAVWVIDPDRRDARVYRADGTQSWVAPDGALHGEGVLPGFTCQLSELFDQEAWFR